jgi:NADH:ubiquinone oxidoreductase subunit K
LTRELIIVVAIVEAAILVALLALTFRRGG